VGNELADKSAKEEASENLTLHNRISLLEILV